MSNPQAPQVQTRLLGALQANCDRLNRDIGKEIGVHASLVSRLRRSLKRSGIIKRYQAIIDSNLVGLNTLAFIYIKLRDHTKFEDTIEFLLDKSEVQELHCIEGEFSFLLKVRTLTNATLFAFVKDILTSKHNIVDTNTVIVMDTRRETLNIPIELVAQPVKKW